MPTKIEWAEESWNPITGCSPKSEGCRNCYAERMARRLADRYGYPKAPHHFDVTLRPDRLDQPRQWKKWLTIFVCSMSDLFHEDVPLDYQEKVWRTMAYTPRHIYLVLTKRAQQMAARMPLLVKQFGQLINVMGMVSVENQGAADERIPLLLGAPFHTRGISCEPLLEPIRLNRIENHNLDWVIIGSESGPGARAMDENWVRGLVSQCKQYKIPVFYKQKRVNGKKVSLPMLDGVQYAEFPQTIGRLKR